MHCLARHYSVSTSILDQYLCLGLYIKAEERRSRLIVMIYGTVDVHINLYLIIKFSCKIIQPAFCLQSNKKRTLEEKSPPIKNQKTISQYFSAAPKKRWQVDIVLYDVSFYEDQQGSRSLHSSFKWVIWLFILIRTKIIWVVNTRLGLENQANASN